MAKDKGRPTKYTDELAQQICTEIAEGSNLNKITQRDDMPSRFTLYKWLDEKEGFSNNYIRAKEQRADGRFDRIDQVILDMRNREIDPQMARVEIDAIKWQAGKENEKYGDKQKVEHSGGLTVERVSFANTDPE